MIEKMKFLSITGPKADIDRMTETYLSRYEIHLENALAELTEVANLSPFLEINPYKDHLNVIDSFYEQLETPEKAVISDMTVETALKTVQNLRNKAQELDAEKSRLQSEHAEMVDSLKIIRPFRNLDFDVSQILNFKYIHYRFGRIEKQYLQKFEKYIYDNLDTLFIKCGEDELYTYGVYFVPEHQAHKVHAVYSSMHFERIFIPDEYHGTAAEAFEKLDRRHREIHAGLDANKAAYRKFLEDSSSAIVSAKAALESCSRSFDIRKLAACTHGDTNTFYILCGWMSEKDADSFQKDIENDTNLFCFIEDDANNVLRQPPTKLKNPKIFRPFEMYVKMYGLPNYNEIDPTIIVGLTYAFIFGIMFADVGQGLCLLIGGALLYHYKKMDLAAIMSTCAVFSVIFGFLFGSFFGFENVIPALWLHPKEAMTTLPFIGSMNTVFVAAVAFGMFMILTGMVLHMINAARNHKLGELLFSQNSLAGFIFYGALAVTLVLLFSGHKAPAVGVMVVMFGIPLLAIFLKEPLERMVEKKGNAFPETGKGMFFVQAFFELFDVLLSYFSNTISFVRVGAYAVSHAAMMEVVLMLGGATGGGSISWPVIVLGNVFVACLEALLVAIQVLRLEYYEMFSRFYEGDGKPFVPFLKKGEK